MKTTLAGAVVCGLAMSVYLTPVSGAEPFGACGPDLATAVESARAHVPHDLLTQQAYDPVPIASTYDPCANLSTVLLSSDRPRPEAPVQAFLFNRGRYVGSAAAHGEPYLGLIAEGSTKDAVVIEFVRRRTCAACGDGTRTPVRYVWTGGSVLKVDATPP